MSGDGIRVKYLAVYVQENGIIRLESNGRLIGQLADDVKFEQLESLEDGDNEQLKIGDRVKHIRNNWGYGTVRDISLSGKLVWVKWDNIDWDGYTQTSRLEKVAEDAR